MKRIRLFLCLLSFAICVYPASASIAKPSPGQLAEKLQAYKASAQAYEESMASCQRLRFAQYWQGVEDPSLMASRIKQVGVDRPKFQSSRQSLLEALDLNSDMKPLGACGFSQTTAPVVKEFLKIEKRVQEEEGFYRGLSVIPATSSRKSFFCC